MVNSTSFSLSLVVFFGIFYSAVFIMSVVGNTWVLTTCYVTPTENTLSRDVVLANLASADLLFTFLTILNAIGFYWRLDRR